MKIDKTLHYNHSNYNIVLEFFVSMTFGEFIAYVICMTLLGYFIKIKSK